MVKTLPTNAGDARDTWIPESGRSPGVGTGKVLQYSCLENSLDRGTWWATVHGVAKESDMTECTHACVVTREKVGFVIRKRGTILRGYLHSSSTSFLTLSCGE